jgi:hypothetical protein
MSSAASLRPAVIDAANPTEPRQQRAALAVAMLGFAVVTLDAQIVNVALPSIHNALGGGLSGLAVDRHRVHADVLVAAVARRHDRRSDRQP